MLISRRVRVVEKERMEKPVRRAVKRNVRFMVAAFESIPKIDDVEDCKRFGLNGMKQFRL